MVMYSKDPSILRRLPAIVCLSLMVLIGSSSPTSASEPDFRTAAVYFAEGRYDASEERLSRGLDRETHTEAVALYFRARIAAYLGDSEAAFTLFERIIEADPSHANAHYRLGVIYGERAEKASFLGKPVNARNARKAFERAIELDPRHHPARRALIEYYIHAPGILGGGMEEATAMVDSFLAIDPTRGHLARALVHAEEEDQAREEASYRSAIASSPESARPKRWLATFLDRHGRRDEGIRLLEDHFQKHPPSPLAILRLSSLYLQANRPADALQLADSALSALSDSMTAVLADSIRNKTDVDRLIRIQTRKMRALFTKGHYVARTGEDLAGGREALSQYLALAPDSRRPNRAHAHFFLGRIDEQLGDLSTAKQSYQTALRINEKHEPARKALDTLD